MKTSLPPSRKEAKLVSSITYFTGNPCKYGHISTRNTKNGSCSDCCNTRSLKHYHDVLKLDPEFVEEHKRQSRERHKLVGTKWYHENKEKASAQNKAWIKRHKEEFRQYCIQWRRNNLPKLCVNTTAYRAQKIQATPSWINEEAVDKIYEQATQMKKETGIKYSVDHIVPLTSDLVCGLHVENNLQIITLKENSSKNCRWWPQQDWEYFNR
jgi:hypothetical protein